jgi:hypothetical protein
MPVQRAQAALEASTLEWMKAHPDLTYAEVLSCMHQVTGRTIKYAIRQERHPNDPDAKGDEA